MVAADVVGRRLRFPHEDGLARRGRTMDIETSRHGVRGGRHVPGEALLTRTLVELADSLVEDFDVVDLPTLLADRCVEVVDVAAAGLMLASADGELRVLASSSEAMRVLEVFEGQAEEGPCIDAYRSSQPA